MAQRVRRQAGTLRLRGEDDSTIRARYEQESERMDPREIEVMFGSEQEIRRLVSGAPTAPGYQSRGRALLHDGNFREVMPVGKDDPCLGHLYISAGETARRNKNGTDPVRFPNIGEVLMLHAKKKRSRRAASAAQTTHDHDNDSDVDDNSPEVFPRRVVGLWIELGRKASATVQFSEPLPLRADLETAREQTRYDASAVRARVRLERAQRLRDGEHL